MSTTPEEFGAKLPGAIEGIAAQAMQKIVLTIEGAVKKRTPVKTGTLRRSVTSAVRRAGLEGAVGTNVIYARPVERRAKMFERGLADSQGQIDRILEEAGLDALEGAAS